jgi:nucleotide-binding universal stress UspA family protein
MTDVGATNTRKLADTPHIVVGVDGSEPSREALRWAFDYADLIDGEVDAVICWTFPTNAGWPGGVLTEWNPEEDATKALAATVADVLGSRPAHRVTQLVRQGNAARVLLDETKDAQLLVVGSRGHGGFAGLLLGSVSANCAEHAHCPVLVVHGKAQS